jgi:putative transposase
MDRLLDHPKSGPVFLKQKEIAEMVVQSVVDGENRFGRYELHSFVVMPNHVHLLVTPHVPASVWLGNDQEFARVRRYIEWNPVKAGLVTLPEEFPWSSAAP